MGEDLEILKLLLPAYLLVYHKNMLPYIKLNTVK